MFAINAEVRKEQSKGVSRRLRATNKSPAITHGGKEVPLTVELDHGRVMNMQVKAEFYSEVLIIVVDDREIEIKAQDVQRHPYKPKLLHIDFVRVQLLNKL